MAKWPRRKFFPPRLNYYCFVVYVIASQGVVAPSPRQPLLRRPSTVPLFTVCHPCSLALIRPSTSSYIHLPPLNCCPFCSLSPLSPVAFVTNYAPLSPSSPYSRSFCAIISKDRDIKCKRLFTNETYATRADPQIDNKSVEFQK